MHRFTANSTDFESQCEQQQKKVSTKQQKMIFFLKKNIPENVCLFVWWMEEKYIAH